MLTQLKQQLMRRSNDHAGQRSDILIVIAGSCGLFIHLCIITFSFVMALWPLFLLNIGSCLAWAFIIYLGRISRTSLAIHIGTAEVIAHSLATTLLLGPQYGFHYYLWPISILIALNPSLNSRLSAFIAGATVLLFAYLDTYPPSGAPLQLSAATLSILHVANIVVSGFSMILTGMTIKRLFSKQQSVLKDLAETDELTRVFNRRYALKFLLNAEANRRRNQLPYCVCLCDLDHFKQINDTHGHALGDEVLEKFARFLKSSVRETDCVARWGGEEFLIILTHTEGEAAELAMNHILEKLRTVNRIVIDGEKRLSTSIGIAEARAHGDIDSIVVRADTALYEAKSTGRDRVVYNSTD